VKKLSIGIYYKPRNLIVETFPVPPYHRLYSVRNRYRKLLSHGEVVEFEYESSRYGLLATEIHRLGYELKKREIESEILKVKDVAEMLKVKKDVAEMLKVKDVARMTGMSENTVRILSDQGAITAYRIAGSRGDRRFRLEDVQDFLEKRKIKGTKTKHKG
jgi:excisionase family DNA binding protein